MLKCKQKILSSLQSSTLNVKVDKNALKIVDAYKYLDVWITNDLSWAKQIEKNCKKANKIIGRRFYKFYSTDVSMLSFVHPHLEYAVPVWYPHLIKHTDLLKKKPFFLSRSVCLIKA